MSGKIKELDLAENFQTETQSGVILVDFSATWCRPCQMQLAILEKVAEKLGNQVRFMKIDTDKFGAIAQQFRVSSIPALLIFKNGKVVESFVGLQDENTLASALSQHVGTA
jgi:thioredoxin 1